MLTRGLYAIADEDVAKRAGVELLPFISALLEARPAILQVRAKSLSARDYLALLTHVVAMAKPFAVPVFANDRPDLAWLAGCDGVHVGQSDLPVDAVRRFQRNLRVGVSTHNVEQVQAALELCPDYVAIGPIYDTTSKQIPEATVGLTLLQQAHDWAFSRRIPLVAIGGIDAERARDVRRWADYVAAISALMPCDGALSDVTALARQFQEVVRAV